MVALPVVWHCRTGGGASSRWPTPCSCGAAAAPVGERVAHPWRPAVLGVLSAVVLGAFAARFGDDVVLAAYAVFGLSLVAISAVDFERQIIPNRLVYPHPRRCWCRCSCVSSAVDDRWGSLARAAIAGAAAFVAFLVVHLAVPRGMGFGDVRLAGVIGLATGWLGLGHAFVGFFAAFVLGAAGRGRWPWRCRARGARRGSPSAPSWPPAPCVTMLWGSPVAHALFHRTV